MKDQSQREEKKLEEAKFTQEKAESLLKSTEEKFEIAQEHVDQANEQQAKISEELANDQQLKEQAKEDLQNAMYDLEVKDHDPEKFQGENPS